MLVFLGYGTRNIQKCASAINTEDQMRDRQSDKTILDHVDLFYVSLRVNNNNNNKTFVYWTCIHDTIQRTNELN